MLGDPNCWSASQEHRTREHHEREWDGLTLHGALLRRRAAREFQAPHWSPARSPANRVALVMLTVARCGPFIPTSRRPTDPAGAQGRVGRSRVAGLASWTTRPARP